MRMKIGAVYPQTEFPSDPGALTAFAQAIEGMGYRHFLAYDHVLGAGRATRPDWAGPYDADSRFHEIFVLMAFVAAVTERVELVTGVVILPQRQTALVAKQAASVDVLSGGRMRLGIGVGWNPVEYEGLGKEFADRGARSEEQIQLMRALWAENPTTFHGKWESVVDAGINPLPVARSIPVWLGGYVEATLKRAARMADGWFPWTEPDAEMEGMLERLREYTVAAGRAADAVKLEPQLNVGRGTAREWSAFIQRWTDLGATQFCLSTLGNGFSTPDQHLAALERAARELGVG